MSRPSLSIGSDSLRSCLAPRDQSTDSDSDICYDTALPPITSKQLMINSRSYRGSDPSIVVGSFRGNQKAAAALGFAPDMSSMTRGPNAHRRTGSTLKTVMRKIFTRKARGSADGCEEALPDFRLNNPQESRPDKDTTNYAALSNSLKSKYSSPIQEEPKDPKAFEDTLLKLEMRPPRTRRATLPSLVFSDDDESRDALDALIHSDPTESRSKSPCLGDHDERRRELLRSKRRSRSATALRGLAKHHRMSPIQWRRRSIESYVTSTACGAASDTDLMSIRPPTRGTAVSAPQTAVEPSVDGASPSDDPADEESIPPNVGTLVSAMQHDDSISLEQRLTTLEVKLIDLEFAIARMQTERSEPSPTATSSRKQSQNSSTEHKRKKSTTQPPPSGSEVTSSGGSAGDRPLSTATIRPSTQQLHRSKTLQSPSLSSLSDHNAGISVEQYSALVMLLRREQNARRSLEHEVSGLRSDIQQLQQLAQNSMGLKTMYPIRNADSQEFMRPDSSTMGYSQTIPVRTEQKLGPPYESDSDYDRSDTPTEDTFRSRWPPNRRLEIGNMI
ncbi:hypothetical protein ANOM_008578 [Aspergillus nomiae NRRL 13137]|uniref:Uncharacterized protein n=1 Tax=Aspergillus nomiae NRRL (strain ATCC 15546 / NRRL 13137 / CBS 260.88 / M93) TaxID=1509407 RepID=A0A0L1IXN9_ASPN3|nr:uncharacterized protein ANOM_008578 [Aspergillus nomiae NRRL 13137]KNG84180.1 hypothetical protein ANOM_008578 [Aspergillus nomiae NRRL 13137]